MSYVEAGCRCLLVLVFAVSSTSKLRDRAAWRRFTESVAGLAPVQRLATTPTAVAVVAAEVATTLALAIEPTARVGFATAAGILVALTSAVIIAYRRERRVQCACFGSGSVVGPRHVVRNAILGAVAVAGLLTASGDPGFAVLPPGVHPAGAAIAIVAGLLGGIVMIMFDDLVELFAPAPVRAGTPQREPQ
ncbi:MauE/DoxX family redox-associated membrane protein [Dactylosporangium sp. NPDC048998]|uniref:MauE/DoxX family redox-associated membrane protein n=1 Tax=Dactylosporangium sp. NPDC048998 TaxID=3363976 RepID=UPI0037170DBE